MARHHVRDNDGNLHFLNDQEYFNFKHKGCLSILTILFIVIIGFDTIIDNKKTDDQKTENVVNVDVQKTSVKKNESTDRTISTNTNSKIEETENVEIDNSVNLDAESATPTNNTQNNNIEEVDHHESYSEDNDVSNSESNDE